MANEVEENKVLSTPYVAARKSQLDNIANNINPYKVPELIFTGSSDAEAMSKFIGNSMASTIIPEAILTSESWRNFSQNGVCDIEDSVVLCTEKVEFGEGVQYETGDMFSAASESGPMKTIKQGVEGANAGVNTLAGIMSGDLSAAPMPEDSYISRFSGMRYLKSITSTGISEITFKFRIGQGGLFDARKEVVEPIVAIACCFAPFRKGNGFVEGPVPTKAELLSEVTKSLFSTMESAGIRGKDGTGATTKSLYGNSTESSSDNVYTPAEVEAIKRFYSEGFDKRDDIYPESVKKIKQDVALKNKDKGQAILDVMRNYGSSTDSSPEDTSKTLNTIAGIEKSLMDALNQAAYNVMTGGKTRTMSIKIGHMLFGPYYAGNINWTFDYTNVDQNGWPCAGHIQISDLKPVLVIDRFDIRNKLGLSKPNMKAEDDGMWRCPVSVVHISSPFGSRLKPTLSSSRMSEIQRQTSLSASNLSFASVDSSELSDHKGVDLTGTTNDAIFSAYNGKVTYCGFDGVYGNKIVVQHDGKKSGYETWYCHLNAMLVSLGDQVSSGEQIGTMGSTGQSTGTHLHFQIMKGGSPVNPAQEVEKIGSGSRDYNRTTVRNSMGNAVAVSY